MAAASLNIQVVSGSAEDGGLEADRQLINGQNDFAGGGSDGGPRLGRVQTLRWANGTVCVFSSSSLSELVAVSDLSVFPNHSSSSSFRLICCLTNFWGAVAQAGKERRKIVGRPRPLSLSPLTPHPIRAKKKVGRREGCNYPREEEIETDYPSSGEMVQRELLKLGGATVMNLFYGEAPSPQSPPISRRRNPLIFRDGDSSRERRRRRQLSNDLFFSLFARNSLEFILSHFAGRNVP